MAPTASILGHPSNHPSIRYPHRFRRQNLNLARQPLRLPSAPRSEQIKARTLVATMQPSAVLEGPPPPPAVPTPTGSVAYVPEPSAVPSHQPQVPNPPADIPGNIVAAIAVVVLILGGLIGLVVGGEMLRRRAKTEGRGVHSRNSGRRKSELTSGPTGSPRQRASVARGKFPYDEKTLTPPTRPLPVLNRERQRRLSDVWPIRSLSMALSNRRPCSLQVERSLQCSPPLVNPHTTWSEFSPVSSYVPPPRTFLACIPEEHEDAQSQTNSDIEAILGITFQRPLESGSTVPTRQTAELKLSRNMHLDGYNGSGSSTATERCGSQDRQVTYKKAASDEDSKSLESSAPDMTSDGGESSRSSMASLGSLGEGNDKESLREEVFELRRAQTRSMQMNKGVLLSLGFKTLEDDIQNSESTRGEYGASQPSSGPNEEHGGKDYTIERELSLAVFGSNFSAVNLDEFPSPPSILPLIPSFASGF